MNTDKPSWTTLSSAVKYDNAWIRVVEDQVINPGGKPGIYGKVHFKNTAIGIVPLDADMNTWLVGQQRYVINEWSWEIPEGGGQGEDLVAAAKRELKEETGLTAARWTPILKVHLSNSVSDEVGVVFLAEDLTVGEPDREASEADMKVKKLPLQEAIQMVLNGQITDSLSVTALLKVARMFKL